MKENDSKGPSLRTFVGIELSDSVNAVLDSWMQQEQLVNALNRAGIQARKILDRNRHITLVFLGDTPLARIEVIQEALASVSKASPAFRLHFDRVACFPDTKSRIIAALCPLAPELDQLHQTVSEQLGEADRRRFKPHITLARLKRPMSGLDPLEFAPLELNVGSVSLFESQLTPSGSEYSVIRRWPLTG